MESFYLFKDLEIAGKESVGNYQKHLKRNTFNIDEFKKIINFWCHCFWINVDLSLEDVTHYMIKDEKLKKCLTFTKIFWNYQKQEFIQKWKFTQQSL
nr:hypothetical protein [Mycoplasmopsis bovis]